ncbi:MAG: hypothetical protein ACE5JP_07010 [Candidatus Bipolaricaulia bacterium]
MPEVNSPEQVVEVFRNAGLVGAGGAGFPTYFKYLNPPPILIVNAEEGEPGYEADKLILHNYVDEFQEVLNTLKEIFGFERIIIGAKDKDEDDLKYLEDKFEIAYTESTYGMGEERWLTKAVTGIEVPADEIPPQYGVTVNNVETVYNMYRALFLEQPVTDKFFNVYGEVAEQRVYLAPIGTYVVDILGITGVITTRSHKLMVIDGGPMMGDRVDVGQYGIKKTTNGLLIAEKSLYSGNQQAFKYLEDKDVPIWGDTLPVIMDKLGLSRYLDWDPQPDDIIDLRDKVERVRISVQQNQVGKPSQPTVEVGQEVKVGDVIGEPVEGDIKDIANLSIALHASIDGVVKEVSEDAIVIERT